MTRIAVVALAMLIACKSSDPAPSPAATSSAVASSSAVAPSSSVAPSSASAVASASASASAFPAPSLKSFPGTEAGAKSLLAEFVKPNADVIGLSRQLRPTSADYKTIFDAPSAARIDGVYSKEWDAGNFVVKPAQGQTDVKLVSATIADLKTGTAKAKDFPSAYKQVASHLPRQRHALSLLLRRAWQRDRQFV